MAILWSMTKKIGKYIGCHLFSLLIGKALMVKESSIFVIKAYNQSLP